MYSNLPPPFCWHKYGNLQIFPNPTEYPIIDRKNCIFPDQAARLGSSPPGGFELIECLCGGDNTIVTPWVPSPRALVFNGAISCPFVVEFRNTPPPTITPPPFASNFVAFELLVMIQSNKHTPALFCYALTLQMRSFSFFLFYYYIFLIHLLNLFISAPYYFLISCTIYSWINQRRRNKQWKRRRIAISTESTTCNLIVNQFLSKYLINQYQFFFFVSIKYWKHNFDIFFFFLMRFDFYFSALLFTFNNLNCLSIIWRYELTLSSSKLINNSSHGFF